MNLRIEIRSAIFHINLLLIVLFISACQTTNIRKDYSLSEAEKSQAAIVVGSVTQNMDTRDYIIADFRIDNHTRQDTKIMYSKEKNPLFQSLNKYDFEDAQTGGRVFVLEIKAGKHQLDYWAVNSNNLTVFPKVPPPKLEFTIEPGQVLYLGNFHLQVLTRKNLFGVQIPDGGVPVISNKYERDVQYARDKFPQLANSDVVDNTLYEGPWIDKIHEDEKLVIPKSK